MSFQIDLLKLQHDIRMAAVMLQVLPSFFAEYSEKCLFISANTYKIIVCIDYCVAFHNYKTCSVSNCKFHEILVGNFGELLKKLDTFCFAYQHMEFLYALFNYQFSGRVFAKCLITCNEQLT